MSCSRATGIATTPVHSMADRFEGLYGRAYNRVIQTSVLRRAAFTVWGSADPLLHLDEIIREAAASSGRGVLLDVPCGGGTVLPMLADTGFAGTVIETDMATAMLKRARETEQRLRPGFTVRFIQADARELPLEDGSVDVVISINGLHVIPEPSRFVAELARVLRPRGSLWLITPVTAPLSLRNRAILRVAEAAHITPGPPPTLPALRALLETGGFEIIRSLGGTSITGVVAERAPD
jgi:ubiquinone/menaquinone biosynthesis C-methylase UbiE